MSSVGLSNQRAGSCRPPEERQAGEMIQTAGQQSGNEARYMRMVLIGAYCVHDGFTLKM